MAVKKTTAASAEKASMPNTTFKLPSGAVFEEIPFKGKHIREALRISDGDQIKSVFALITQCSLIDGKRITIEELDEMSGADVIVLMNKFQGLF